MDSGVRATLRLCLAVALTGLATATPGCKPSAATSSTTLLELPADDELQERIEKVLDYTRARRHLDVDHQAAWQIVHGILEFGRDFQVYHQGKLVSALDYLLGGGRATGWHLHRGDHGVVAVLEPGSKTGQGHPDQWIGYFSQCGVRADDKLVVESQTYTIGDLITQAQWDVYDGMEATWTLMAFSTYLPFDTTWTAKDGSTWTLERIVAMESKAAEDLAGGACGGTHRMYALSLALRLYLDEGGQLTGGWKAAHDTLWGRTVDGKAVPGVVEIARRYQQPDGSFSTNFFERPGTSADLEKRLGATGHTLEFLMVALPDDQLQEPWVTSAALALVTMLENTRELDLECGALYHAAHALDLYRSRRFGPHSTGSAQQAAAEGTRIEADSSDSAAAKK